MIPLCILTIENEDDRAFMTDLYAHYYRLMYYEINQIVHNEWIAEDLLQDVLIKLIEKVSELREKDRNHLINYIISASKNRAKNYLRTKGRHQEYTLEEYQDIPDSQSESSEMEALLIHQDTLTHLTSIWPKLDERSRYLLENYYILGRSFHEIADDLKIKPGSVRMALTRARRLAFKMMTEQS